GILVAMPEESTYDTASRCSLIGSATCVTRHCVFRQACWLIWFAGTALILLSWFGVVSALIGWIGFGIACAAALRSYLPRKQIPRNQDWALLTTDMIEVKDHRYDSVIKHLQSGRPAFYDGIGISMRPGNEFALVIEPSVQIHELDEQFVMREVSRARSMLEKLTRASPEIAAMASDGTLRISIMSEFTERGFEVCRIVNDTIDWKVNGNKPTAE